MTFIQKFFIAVIFALICSLTISAQTNEVLAKIGDKALTVSDLEPQISAEIARLPQQIVELRKNELKKEIDNLLFDVEALASKTTREKLLDAEVKKRVAAPPAEQVQSIYDANRSVFGDATFEQAKGRIVNYLRREQEEQLSAGFADKLRVKHKVTIGVDVNSPALKPADVLATVGGKTITAAAFNERLKPLEYNLRYQAFDLKQQALSEAIFQNLIMAESAATNTPPNEIIQREISDKMRDFTDEERFKLNTALFEKLRVKHKVQILLQEPEAPVLKISADDDPAQGTATAPVTIVMFSDFQCPACSRTHPVVKEVLKNYSGKVRFVVRDFPLEEIHENAFRAAEAAGAANAQGKFFEYIDVLYQNQKALTDASLEKYAAQIGLNVQKFKADLASGRFSAEIRKDQEDGKFYGINSTPTIFVNGVKLNDLSAEGLKSLIEKALAKK